MMEQNMVMRTGKNPECAMLIGQTELFKVWLLQGQQAGEWHNLRVTAKKPMAHKANWSTAYSVKQKRMAESKCWKLFLEHKTALQVNDVKSIVHAYFENKRA